MQPERRPVSHLHRQHEADDDVADDDDGEIGRSIVGPMVMQRLPAFRTMVRDFEVAPEHGALAASRAAKLGPAQER